MHSPARVGAPMVTTDSWPGLLQGPYAPKVVAASDGTMQPASTRCSPVPPLQYDAETTIADPATQPVGSAEADGAATVEKVAPATHAAPARTMRKERLDRVVRPRQSASGPDVELLPREPL